MVSEDDSSDDSGRSDSPHGESGVADVGNFTLTDEQREQLSSLIGSYDVDFLAYVESRTNQYREPCESPALPKPSDAVSQLADLKRRTDGLIAAINGLDDVLSEAIMITRPDDVSCDSEDMLRGSLVRDLEYLSRTTKEYRDAFADMPLPRGQPTLLWRNQLIADFVNAFHRYYSEDGWDGDVNDYDFLDACEQFIWNLLTWAGIPTPATPNTQKRRQGEATQGRLRRQIKEVLRHKIKLAPKRQ